MLQGHAILKAAIAAPMAVTATRDITVEYRPSIAKFGAIRMAVEVEEEAGALVARQSISRATVLALQPKLRREHTSNLSISITRSLGRLLTSLIPRKHFLAILMICSLQNLGITIRITTPTKPSSPPPP